MSASFSIDVALSNEEHTRRVAAILAPALAQAPLPFVIFLSGELGAGKTTLVRALLRAMGFGGRVKSPTYALVEVYVISGLNLYHFDFYRLKDPDEWHESGFRDALTDQAISLIEWPQKALGAGVSLPPADLEIALSMGPSNDARQLRLSALSSQAIRLLQPLASTLK
ncbi:MAG: tRNA (adenosine(37)-N6)-threonylcarbamoyltransferase complex ATPase subunit type 1 TsaE [Burkholderiales bacterium]|jgi:tRNA threonylcarbamoyladenosine biosynthesis protein TsaE|nr:tRNA (adenosine(37)-N6)-threonylcarbamoyltransferase complex ATPase subunit type 1 TsaE [Nitrosomonadaceae bacterium]